MACLLGKENGKAWLWRGFERLLSHTDRICLTPHSGVVFATVPGSPQTGPRGPHMVQVQEKMQTGIRDDFWSKSSELTLTV